MANESGEREAKSARRGRGFKAKHAIGRRSRAKAAVGLAIVLKRLAFVLECGWLLLESLDVDMSN